MDVNEDQMQVNRTKLQQCLKMWADDDGYGPRLTQILSSDTTYNNNAKGRAFSQPGTQASAPLIETETNGKMVVAFSTVSKHCRVPLQSEQVTQTLITVVAGEPTKNIPR